MAAAGSAVTLIAATHILSGRDNSAALRYGQQPVRVCLRRIGRAEQTRRTSLVFPRTLIREREGKSELSTSGRLGQPARLVAAELARASC